MAQILPIEIAEIAANFANRLFPFPSCTQQIGEAASDPSK